jgi:hypothetical protein
MVSTSGRNRDQHLSVEGLLGTSIAGPLVLWRMGVIVCLTYAFQASSFNL